MTLPKARGTAAGPALAAGSARQQARRNNRRGPTADPVRQPFRHGSRPDTTAGSARQPARLAAVPPPSLTLSLPSHVPFLRVHACISLAGGTTSRVTCGADNEAAAAVSAGAADSAGHEGGGGGEGGGGEGGRRRERDHGRYQSMISTLSLRPTLLPRPVKTKWSNQVVKAKWSNQAIKSDGPATGAAARPQTEQRQRLCMGPGCW